MTFHATSTQVEIQDAAGAVFLVPTLLFYDAIPGAPYRGTARIDGMERVCSIVEYDQFSPLQEELIQYREFIPIETWINEYAENEDLERGFEALKSFSFFNIFKTATR